MEKIKSQRDIKKPKKMGCHKEKTTIEAIFLVYRCPPFSTELQTG